MAIEKIVVKGAKVHNLKDIDVEIPRDEFVVITGLSGSGKSSLAFDTIYAEGQRRYVESLSSYARQFLGQMEKPDVEYIEGLSPAISIDQKTTSRNPRSTVGTVTEIHDYLRLLFARIGTPHCPKCAKVISQQTIEQIVDQIMAYEERTKLQILAPIVQGRKGEHQKIIEDLKKSGFVRLRVNGEIRDIDEEIELDKNKKHSIEVVIDRIIVKEGIENRLADSLEIALNLSEGVVYVLITDDEKDDELVFSQNFACIDCGISLAEITPRMFSFNSPFGACEACDGLGTRLEVDLDMVMPDKSLSLEEGAIAAWSRNKASYYYQILNSTAKAFKIDLTIPVKDLPKEKLDLVLYGSETKKVQFRYTNIYGNTRDVDTYYEGVIPNLERRFKETSSESARLELEKYMSQKPCLTCKGARLRPESLAVTINDINIHEFSIMNILEASEFMKTLELSERKILIARQILKEIGERLGFLVNVGLGYLNLSRSAGTLSGGEAQRIRLATQIGSGLVGVLYILDEPSIGLHQRDNDRLIQTLKSLRDLGNTLIIVEHDEETMLSADHIIDIGPKAGAGGGELVAQGTLEDIKNTPESITGQYLRGEKEIEIPKIRRQITDKTIQVKKASENNLQNIDVEIPIGVFTCVTGVSGSGKSTLINDILLKSLEASLYPTSKSKPGKHKEVLGVENLEKVINIDQSPIGRTPRSNSATYTGVFDDIRGVFAQTPEARMRGYKPGRFSFNVKGGRCEACRGDGILKIEMHFLPDVYVPCEVCKGKRYNRETLEIKYKGKTIAGVLEMTVEEAVEFFQNIPRIHRKLKTLEDVGLGYIRLGQPATTLSGGEAQRVKLASQLSRRSNGKSFYILDEPTTGLHIADIHKLLDVLNRLVEAGDTVVVIEHNLDVIKCADYIIDLGPEGGDKGGEVVATGTPEQLVEIAHSHTGQYLKKTLNKA